MDTSHLVPKSAELLFSNTCQPRTWIPIFEKCGSEHQMLLQIRSTEIRETRLGELEKNARAVGNCDLALDSSKDTASLVGRQRLYIAAQQWWHTASLYLVLLEVWGAPHHERKEGDRGQEPGRPLCEEVGTQRRTKACQVQPGFRLRTSGRAVPARRLCR
uniref:Uncharacterized protein n=1 Tax=Rousettus aegyptiacus TaxID=9407 RepID=A0A7J8H1Q0_ROUAE|nr:hypothetical protein HJG63_011392 [Rousettus aegyptiacus]